MDNVTHILIWLSGDKLFLHLEKTEAILIGSNQLKSGQTVTSAKPP